MSSERSTAQNLCIDNIQPGWETHRDAFMGDIDGVCNRTRISPDSFVVIGEAGLALNGLHPWAPDAQRQSLAVDAIVPDVIARQRWEQHVGFLRRWLGSHPHAFELGPERGPIFHGRAIPFEEGVTGFEGLRDLSHPSPRGWRTLAPGMLAWRMLTEEVHPPAATIATILRTQHMAHHTRTPIEDAWHWRSAVGRAVELAYDNRELGATPQIGKLIRTGFRNNPAFSFVGAAGEVTLSGGERLGQPNAFKRV